MSDLLADKSSAATSQADKILTAEISCLIMDGWSGAGERCVVGVRGIG